MAEGAVTSNLKIPIFPKMTPYTQYRCHGTFSCIFWLLAPFFHSLESIYNYFKQIWALCGSKVS